MMSLNPLHNAMPLISRCVLWALFLCTTTALTEITCSCVFPGLGFQSPWVKDSTITVYPLGLCTLQMF